MQDYSKVTDFIKDAICDFAENADSQSTSEWLQGYLGKKLPDKTVDAIHSISTEVISTLDLMEEKKALLDNALENGKSAENWFAEEVMSDEGNNSDKARTAAEFFNGIAKAGASYEDSESADIIDVEANDEEWQEDKWNDYKTKDTVKKLAIESGKAGLKEIASDVFLQAGQNGITTVLADKPFMTETLVKGSCEGLKVAVSAGLTIAQSAGVFPQTSLQVLATTAFSAVESLKSFSDVLNGKATVMETLIKIKNTTVATFLGMWKQHKNKLLSEISDAVGVVFGTPGAAIAGAVTGLFADKAEKESRFVTVVKSVAKAVAKTLTKRIELPFKSKNKVIEVNPS